MKARAAFNIIKDAIHTGAINDETILLDATSGNTGIAYATIGAQIGLPVTLCLPENASKERIHILKSLGAKIIFTSRFGGTDDAQQVAAELAEEGAPSPTYSYRCCGLLLKSLGHTTFCSSHRITTSTLDYDLVVSVRTFALTFA